MKRDQLSDALGLLYDDLIKETGQLRQNRPSPRRRFLIMLLKRICLFIFTIIMVLIIVNAMLPETEYPIKNMRGEPITVGGIAGYTGALLLGVPTYAYLPRYGESLDDVMFSPVQGPQDVEALHVYTPIDVQGIDGYVERCSKMFSNGLQAAFGGMAEVHQDPDNEFLWTVRDGGRSILSARYDFNNRNGRVSSRFLFHADGDEPLLGISLPVNASDQEALDAGWAITDLLNSVLGTSYAPQKISRSVGEDGAQHIYVKSWDATGNLQEQLYSACISSIEITFSNRDLPPGSDLRFSGASYSIEEMEPVSDEPLPLLSLDEAEEELENGYVFCDIHICRICRDTVLPVDFSDYDGVEVIYHDFIHPQNIPYYAFYKQISDGEFAVTYVPAVHVEGLDEYFKAAEKLHETQ